MKRMKNKNYGFIDYGCCVLIFILIGCLFISFMISKYCDSIDKEGALKDGDIVIILDKDYEREDSSYFPMYYGSMMMMRSIYHPESYTLVAKKVNTNSNDDGENSNNDENNKRIYIDTDDNTYYSVNIGDKLKYSKGGRLSLVEKANSRN